MAWCARRKRRRRRAAPGAPAQSPRWYEFTLALLLLAAIAAFAIWLISSGRQWAWGETFEDWRSDSARDSLCRGDGCAGVIGLVVSFVYTLAQSSQRRLCPRGRPGPPQPEKAAAAAAAPRDAGGRCAFSACAASSVAIVLLCWIGLAPADQYALIDAADLPASLGVALVLVFDKATRAWGGKSAAEATREWLLCDLLMFLLLLRISEPAERGQARGLCLKFLGHPQPGPVLCRVLGHRPHRLAQPLSHRLRIPGHPSFAALDLDDHAGRCGAGFVVGHDVAVSHPRGRILRSRSRHAGLVERANGRSCRR